MDRIALLKIVNDGYVVTKSNCSLTRHAFDLDVFISDLKGYFMFVDEEYFPFLRRKLKKEEEWQKLGLFLGFIRIFKETLILLTPKNKELKSSEMLFNFLCHHFVPRPDINLSYMRWCQKKKILDKIIFLDLEFTNVYDLGKCRILQIYAMMFSMNKRFGPYVIKIGEVDKKSASHWVKNNQYHLLEEALKSRYSIKLVDFMMSEWLIGKDFILTGNCINTDWQIISREMPLTSSKISKRLDVSSLRMLWNISQKSEARPPPKKIYKHDAETDVLQCMKEFKHYLLYALKL